MTQYFIDDLNNNILVYHNLTHLFFSNNHLSILNKVTRVQPRSKWTIVIQKYIKNEMYKCMSLWLVSVTDLKLQLAKRSWCRGLQTRWVINYYGSLLLRRGTLEKLYLLQKQIVKGTLSLLRRKFSASISHTMFTHQVSIEDFTQHRVACKGNV